jgi:hypothetical protein
MTEFKFERRIPNNEAMSKLDADKGKLLAFKKDLESPDYRSHFNPI